MRVTIEGVNRSLLARVQNPTGRLCGCAPTCWCQRSRLGRALRWYLPIGHRAVDPNGETGLRGTRRPFHLVPQEIARSEVVRLLDEGAQLVEVLPAAEYAEEHLPGAINLPLKELNRATAQRLDSTRPVVVYCWDST